MKQYGLIGFPLSHSFSKRYFKEKFAKENIANAHYELFPLKQISNFKTLLAAHPKLAGLNVTIPYKLAIFDYLDEIDEAAAAIGAVNTITFRSGKLKGYNTDAYGFQSSLVRFLNMSTKDLRSMKALVFGTGGAAKAVVYTLKQLQINY
ncbi:MAG: shikimate dehydrogenase, partial [Bacteroidota bacterium]